MSAHTATRIPRPLHRQCIFQRLRPCPVHRFPIRAFSNTGLRLGIRDPTYEKRGEIIQRRAEKSPGTMEQEETISGGDKMLGDDMGLFQGTFVVGPLTYYGKLLSQPKSAWIVLKAYLRARFSSLREWYIWRRKIKTFFVEGIKPSQQRPKKDLKGARYNAKNFHRDIYEAFAKNDPRTIKQYALSGLRNHLTERLASRPKDTTMTWELCKYYSKPRIMSWRAQPIPLDHITETGLLQCVVRISSRQRLTISTKAKKEVVEEKDKVEYVVVQKRMLRGKEEDWKIWGFTEGTTLESIEKDKVKKEEFEAYQAGTRVAA